MLHSRVDNDQLSRARLSHAIRLNTSPDSWLSISSTNLDELVQRPLPGIKEQITHLVRWLAAKLRDDRFGRISRPPLDDLAGIVGAADGERVGRLIAYGVEQRIVESDDATTNIGLSAGGWAMIEPLKEKEKLEKPNQKLSLTSSSPEIREAHCNNCGGVRKAFKQASHTVDGNDGEVSWSDTFDVLECCGCGGISVRHEHWFSEWDQIGSDPITGEPRITRGTKVIYWPPPTKRKKPTWVDDLDDDVLRRVIDEVYQALDVGLIALASIGTRTLLDRAMFLRVGDPKGGFGGKLAKMFENGHIGLDEKDILTAITDAGSAAAHRGFTPNTKTLGTIIETVENFLQREFVLKTAAGDVRKATPRRGPPSK
jgi:hypothetical protein